MRSALDIEHLYKERGHLVLRRAYQILGNEQESREVLQDVFLSLVDRPEQFSGKSSITTWLYSATTHSCLNRIRKHKTRTRLLERWATRSDADVEPPRAENLLGASQILARIPRKLAQLAVYYYIDEMTQEEIAGVLGCSRRQVGKLLDKMHARLKKLEVVS